MTTCQSLRGPLFISSLSFIFFFPSSSQDFSRPTQCSNCTAGIQLNLEIDLSQKNLDGGTADFAVEFY